METPICAPKFQMGVARSLIGIETQFWAQMKGLRKGFQNIPKSHIGPPEKNSRGPPPLRSPIFEMIIKFLMNVADDYG